MHPRLKDIARLIEARQRDAARTALAAYLREHPDDPDAWYLRALLTGDGAARHSALHRVLRLDPSHERARAALARLEAPTPQRAAGRGRALLLLFLILLAVLSAAAIFLLGPGRTPPAADADSRLPTLAALGPTATTAASAVFVPATPTLQTIPASPTPPAATEPLLPSIVPSAASPSPLPTSIIAAPTITVVRSDTMPPPSAPVSASPTPPSPVSIPVSPTIAPSPTVTTGSSPIPAATPLPGVVLNAPASIGSGQMRLLSVTRPAADRIAELGGSPPALPAGSEWLLVEALAECSGSQNCAPPLSAVRLEGSAGQFFAPAALPGLEPVFAPDAFTIGQVWGYLVFSVPASESNLVLVVARGSVAARFALN